jgi:hypothetical protein
LLATVLVAVLTAGAASAGAKTDRVVLSNGDHLTGEFKGLEQGKLRFNTAATDTIEIEQELVERLTSPRRFEVETESGERYFGRLEEAESDRVFRVAEDGHVHDLGRDEVVRIYPIEAKFVKQLDGLVAIGFNTTKSTDVTTFSFNGNVKYSRERYLSRLALSALTIDQETGSTSRADLTGSSERRLARRWFTLGTGSLQRNEDLGIDLRVLLGAGLGRHVVQTIHQELDLVGGVVFNREEIEGESSSDESWEGFLGARYSIFRSRPRDISLTVIVKAFPGITESSRLRTESSIDYQHEVVSDLTLGLRFYSSTDNEPPPESEKSDYGVVATVGWSF